MKLNISITMDNAAFSESPELEVARILADLAVKVERQGISPGAEYSVRDINGNKVGTAQVTKR